MHRPLHSHLFLQPANILLQDWMVPQGWPHHIIQQMPATTTHTFFLSQPMVPQGWPHHTTQLTHLLLQQAPFSSASQWYHRVGRTPYSRHLLLQHTPFSSASWQPTATWRGWPAGCPWPDHCGCWVPPRTWCTGMTADCLTRGSAESPLQPWQEQGHVT